MIRTGVVFWLAPLLALFSCWPARAQTAPPASSPGVQVHYQLPTDGPLPRTYRVTLAAVDPHDPNWIISEFACGVVRTVTAENGGRFTETWDGLDDNDMPVPAGTYALKGIYMPAERWKIDGDYHTLIPQLASSGGSWGQSPAEDEKPEKIQGDPISNPLADVDVAPNGKGVLYFRYLENGTNNFLIDFTQPVGYGQIGDGYPSGSAAGGSSTCTDGTMVWSFSMDGGVKFIFHGDGSPFGHQISAGRNNVYLPEGWVTGLSAWPDPELGHSVVFVSERGKIIPGDRDYVESDRDFVDQIVALDGAGADELARWKVERPLSVKARGGKLYVLHSSDGLFEVLSLPLDSGWKQAPFRTLFTVPSGITPFDLEVDRQGRIYLSDSGANHVYQFNAQGEKLRTYGRLPAQKGGAYDPESFMAPEKLASWTDAAGHDRLLVVEMAGPNRLSEWSGDDGSLLREWVVPQTVAGGNNGFAVDPRDPEMMYALGQRETLVRWKIDYSTGAWSTDAVWDHVGLRPFGDRVGPEGLAHPKVLYHGDERYLAFTMGSNHFIFHEEGVRWRPCTGIIRENREGTTTAYLWRDLNGDGQLQKREYRPFRMTIPPEAVFTRAFGDTWLDDFSLISMGRGDSTDIWKLSPTGFDRLGNPVFAPDGWKKLLSDPTFLAKQAGTATATHGGNEVGTEFNSDWATTVSAPDGGYYVSARSGPDFSANFGGQYKLSRYVPDGRGGFVQRWRVGRVALNGNAAPGEVYGPIFATGPINGLVGVVDNSRAGVVVYTEDGLYVDTLLADGRILSRDQRGAYCVPGEFFSGYDYLNREDGHVYLALGKTMPEIYRVAGWTATESVVHPLTTLDRTVTLTAGQIATPPEIVLTIRGGAAAARVARFYPAPGGAPALDTSLAGWEGCDPVKFDDGQGQNVEVRCLYDLRHLYLRWQVQLAHPFKARRLLPVESLFAHDRAADTLGLYLQCDPEAPPGGKFPGGRADDVRFVFGLFKDGDKIRPVVLGMYPKWQGAGRGIPITYRTAQTTSFQQVGLVPDATTAYRIDDDRKGFVLTAVLPRDALPGAPALDGLKTSGNFDANLGGENRFWWSNADGSASRETFDEPTEARLFPGSWSQVQFLPMTSLPIRSWLAIGPFGDARLPGLDHRQQGEEIIHLIWGLTFPPEKIRDFGASYEGDLTQTHLTRRRLSWVPVDLSGDNVDFKSALGWPGMDGEEGTGYLLTHIHAPETVAVKLKIGGVDGLECAHGWLNGRALSVIVPGTNPLQFVIDPEQPLTLQAGWNELLLRYDFFYGSHEMGASLVAPPAVLWHLKISGRAPDNP